MQVSLLTYTPNPEQVVAAAARLCYSPKTGAEIIELFDEKSSAQFIGRLTDMGHFSPFEHVSFSFAIDGVSRALSHQLVRHRIASYSQKSQRYVQEKGFAYITPAAIAKDASANADYQQLMADIQDAYDKLLAAGIPAEDARYVLPNATATNLIVTMNARSLHNFFRLRCCNRAQQEIRQMARLMLVEVKKVAPALFAKAGPSCETEQICYEGEKCCKKGLVEIRYR